MHSLKQTISCASTMTPSRWKLQTALLALVLYTAESIPVEDYVVSVVEEMAKSDRSVPHCVFFDPSERYPFDGPVGKILTDQRLNDVTKVVITKPFLVDENFDLCTEPTMVVMRAVLFKEKNLNFLQRFKPSTRVMVLFVEMDEFLVYGRVLIALLYYNAVFLNLKTHQVVVFGIVERKMLDYPANSKDLFKGSFRDNMRGKLIKYMARQPIARGEALISWMNSTASVMNTTAVEMHHNCPLEQAEFMHKCYRTYFTDNKISIELSGLMLFRPVGRDDFVCLFSNLQDNVVLLIPRSPLSIVKLLVLPLKWQVWITLLVLLTTLEVIHLKLPTIFQNDPIILVICGFEKVNLHRASRREKITLFPMIVLMFFIVSTYETKLLAFMVNRPASKELRTFQDLQESGVKIKSNLLLNPAYTNIHGVESLVINSTETIFNMDMIHGHMVSRELAKLVLPKYYDSLHRLHRYHIMQQSLGVFPIVFIMDFRSPLRNAFEYTLNVHIESGIWNHLWATSTKHEISRKIEKTSRFYSENSSPLMLTDLLPAGMVLGFGFAAGFSIFAVEKTFGFIRRCLNQYSTSKLPSEIPVPRDSRYPHIHT